jgi:hypothetical protein
MTSEYHICDAAFALAQICDAAWLTLIAGAAGG